MPDKELLKAKLHEFYHLCAPPEDDDEDGDFKAAPTQTAKKEHQTKGAAK